jgi:hypothetical protein
VEEQTTPVNATPSIRVYADTSVYGGVFDEEFAVASAAFFEQIQAGRYHLVTSALLGDELADAPAQVRQWYERFAAASEPVEVSQAAILLQQAYLSAGIVSRRWAADALHVAVATVSECRAIVSWNFKHIVSFQKIPLYNGVNLTRGFGPVAIHSPREVIEYDDQDI